LEGSLKALKPLLISGREVLPLVEGGKGISVSNGESSGAWAAAGGVGTFSGVNADSFDENGNVVDQVYRGKTRRERHEELIAYSIKGGISQARIAHEARQGEGRIHMNVLWEMGAAERILHGILEGSKGLIHGVTCGAGMPYKVAEIAVSYGIHYYPIVSSARAFRALWKRAYHKFSDNLGGVVYEDPWLAGGHNGLSNSEDPESPEDPFPRVLALRQMMNSFGLENTPIVMAGGVWYLREWNHWIDNPELGQIAFQYGTRPLLTEESPIPQGWKDRLRELDDGDVLLHRFSPTGFYSSAVRNPFLRALEARSERQIPYSRVQAGDHTVQLDAGVKGKNFWVTPRDRDHARQWVAAGFTEALKTPDDTVVFVTPEERAMIREDQAACMGCLSHCGFSSWKDHDDFTTGRLADPRSFCIQKTLQDIAHGGSTEQNLMFAGHGAYRFKQDPFYSNNFTPTVKQLVDRILTGD
jgi:NAD(P)H-dependent flavin oxidoreductase YrpB (nitropropane dioxygenase family)